MKKIFFNNRFIAFSGNASDFENDTHNIYTLKSNTELPKLLDDFLYRCSDNELYILCENEDESFVAFCDLFDMIFAGGGLVKNSHGDILMIYRCNRWDLPKGKQEANEAIDKTALREVEEECGLKNIELGRLITETYHCYMFENRLTMKRTFWYEMFCNQTELKAQTEEGIEKVEFVGIDKIAEKLKNTYSSILEAFKTDGLV